MFPFLAETYDIEIIEAAGTSRSLMVDNVLPLRMSFKIGVWMSQVVSLRS